MSHLSTIKGAEVNDLDALAVAATRLGGTLDRAAQTFVTYGNDRPPCLAAIRFVGARFEVGVVTGAKPGTYALQFDPWSSGGLDYKVGSHGEKLAQAYGVARLAGVYRRQGFTVQEKLETNGTVQLVCTR